MFKLNIYFNLECISKPIRQDDSWECNKRFMASFLPTVLNYFT